MDKEWEIRRTNPETGAEETINLAEGSAAEDFKDFGRAAIEGMIATNLVYFEKLRSLRRLFQGEAGSLWDRLETEARSVPGFETPDENRRDLLRRLEDFTLILTEIYSFLEQKQPNTKEELSPETIENVIATDLTYLNEVKYLRPLLQGEAGALWDLLETEALNVSPRTPPESRREFLVRLENFIVILAEFDTLFKRKSNDLEGKIVN